jgi:hypothetical protein
MDRIDAMKVFVAALDEGSLAGAARRLGKSPAAVSRARSPSLKTMSARSCFTGRPDRSS